MTRKALLDVYRRLHKHFGPQQWWPGTSRFEIIVGAILTQNTAWGNVERALANLKRERLLNPARMYHTRTTKLARLIRSSGFYEQKAIKLKAFLNFLFSHYRGNLTRMFRTAGEVLRDDLLNVHGIGPETADAILLYAGNYPSFVVDAYTRRIFARLGWCEENVRYEELRNRLMEALPREAQLYNEYHALLVALGKNICAKRAPRCANCPLREICPRVGVW